MQAHQTLAFFIITKAKRFSSTFFRKVCLPSASCDSPLHFGMATPRRPLERSKTTPRGWFSLLYPPCQPFCSLTLTAMPSLK